MSQRNDDSIERFFRKAVVQQDKTFMERDWQRMEKMLDAQASASASIQAARIKAVLRATAIIVIIGSLFMIGTENRFGNEIVQMQAAVGTVGPHDEVKKENPTADLHSLLPCDEKPSIKTTRPTESVLSSHEDVHTTLQPVRKVSTINRIVALKSKAVSVLAPDQEVLMSNQNDTAPTSDHPEEQSNQLLPLDVSPRALTHLADETVIQELPKDSLGVDQQALPTPSASEAEDKSDRSLAPRLVVTGLVSPDFSTTSLSRYSRPSGVFGILVGYTFLKRFTLVSGVTKSLKKYEGSGSEYTPPEGYWQNRTNGIIPDQVAGKCGIIEVPVIVQYDLVQRRKSRIFLSTGVSSYFMRSENYQYTFNEPNPGAANSWTAKKPTRYLFKIGHVSAGYDRTIGKGLSIGIEPFLKLPFEGIGWTDINLYSTGAYFNVRYTILRTQQ